MTRNEHLLSILAEECVEVAQRVTKALRFGLAEIQPGQLKTNAQRIMDEINDLLAIYQMVAGENKPLFEGSVLEWQMALDDKKEKVEKFLKYSTECGTVNDH
jgi:NTP pyrophosphatase (non-canonical NTP hydrolase)